MVSLERVAEELKKRLKHVEAVKLLAEVVTYSVLGVLLLLALYLLLASTASFVEKALSQLKP